MVKWKYKTRKINGRNRRVKVYRTAKGTERVRIVGHKNYTDRTR